MKCIKCGNKIKKKYNLCPTCGNKVMIFEKKNNNKKKRIILILVVVLILTCCCFLLFNKNENILTLRKSVVKINMYDDEKELIQTGSGVIAFDYNILITNAHVITGGDIIEAVSETNKKLKVKGVIYYNEDDDIAILKLNEQKNIRPLKIAKKYNVGDKVIAIGSPLGLKNSVSDGIISNILKDKTIQHTAPISPGSSGGALLTLKGELVGINTATIEDGQNINLSIPIKKILKKYEKNKNVKLKNIVEVQPIDFSQKKWHKTCKNLVKSYDVSKVQIAAESAAGVGDVFSKTNSYLGYRIIDNKIGDVYKVNYKLVGNGTEDECREYWYSVTLSNGTEGFIWGGDRGMYVHEK